MSRRIRFSVCAVGLLGLFVPAQPLLAATRTVSVFTDGNPGTPPGDPTTGTGQANDLRSALIQAQANDEIVFNCPASPCTITLSGPLPPITGNLAIDGGGQVTIDGAGNWRAFFVDTGTVAIRNLTIQNVRAKGGDGGTGGGGGGAGLGAGVFVNQQMAHVTIQNVHFSNTAVEGGKGGDGGFTYSSSGGGGGLGGSGGAGAVSQTPSLSGGGGGGVIGDGVAALNSAPSGRGGYGGGGGGSADAFGGTAGAGGQGYATNSPGFDGDSSSDAAAGGFGGGGGGGGVFNAPGIGGFGGGCGGASGGEGAQGGTGGGGGATAPSIANASIDPGGPAGASLGAGVAGGKGGDGSSIDNGANAYSGGGGGAAAGPAIFVRLGTVATVASTSSQASAVGGAGGTGFFNGDSGTANATAVFNFGGMVNGSAITGPIAGALPGTSNGLTVSVAGDGVVSSSIGGLSCTAVCSVSIGTITGQSFTTVTLTATPAGASTFTGWSGDCSDAGTASTATVTMNAARACIATFGDPVPNPTPVPMPIPNPTPAFVSASTPIPAVAAASTVGSGTGSLSFASSFTNPQNLTFTAAQSGGGALPSWLTFTPSTVSFSYDVPMPADLPIQPMADADGRSGRADARASWANTVYPPLLRVAQVPVSLTAVGEGQSYATTILMNFYAPRRPVAMSVISLGPDRAPGNAGSSRSAMSWDGGQMVFETAATNIFPNSPNSSNDILRYHALSGTLDRLSQTAIPGGGVANAADGASWSPAVSSDGRHAAFASDAPGITLVPNGQVRQVYRSSLVYPRVPLNQAATPVPDLVSMTAAGVAGNGTSDNPDISQDGRYVVFESTATNFGPGLDGTKQIWRKDLQTGALDLVSGGRFPGNGASANPSISWDGRYVAFDSLATNLGGRGLQVYLRDMTSGAIRAVVTGAQPRLSARADRIAFITQGQVAAIDLGTGTTRQVAPGTQHSMSADGRFVAYRGTGTGNNGQIWVHDIDRGVTALVTQTATGAPGNGPSWYPALSGDGSMIGFGSMATDLVNGNPAAGQMYLAANPLPLPAKTGYWYMADIGGGQGWAMERWGSRAYVGGLAYDAQGRSQWLAGFCTLSGLTCRGTLNGGPAFTLVMAETGDRASLTVGGATALALAMFPIGGTARTGFAGLPQAGWWYDAGAGDNVGYFLDIDTQPRTDGSVAQIAYLTVLGYDAAGRAVWQVAQAALGPDLGFSGTLTQYAGGAPFGIASPAIPASGSMIGPVRMAFDGTDRARISLPDGRIAQLSRFRF